MQQTNWIEQKATAVLRDHWNNSAPVDPFAIARKMGATIEQHLGSESGCLDITNDGVVIRVNPNDAPYRQRFTVAHEIGHWQLVHGNRFRDTSANFTTAADWHVEREANEFAACLLMPRPWVEHLALRLGWNVSNMAAELGVSKVAMEYRLKNLGITT